MLLVGQQEGHPACKKTEWWGGGMVICLEWGTDMHMAQLMPLPLTVSCFSKILIGFTFLGPAHPVSPGQRPVKRVCVSVYKYSYLLTVGVKHWKLVHTHTSTVCVCVCVCVCACVRVCVCVCLRCSRQHGVHGRNARPHVRDAEHGDTRQTGGVRPTTATEVCPRCAHPTS